MLGILYRYINILKAYSIHVENNSDYNEELQFPYLYFSFIFKGWKKFGSMYIYDWHELISHWVPIFAWIIDENLQTSDTGMSQILSCCIRKCLNHFGRVMGKKETPTRKIYYCGEFVYVWEFTTYQRTRVLVHF